MFSNELRQNFLKFFEKRGHRVVASSSLIPDDPSVLLTTAGMQQFKRYYTGELDPIKDFSSKNTASIQKCFRTSDINEVGDESHLTFFEMLGNFSFGGYFKKEAIQYAYDFFKEVNLPIDFVTIFGGDKEVPEDKESEEIWKNLDVKKIEKHGREDNFWGPTGSEGPCGPTTELYVKGVEIWNIVFNQYYCQPDKTLVPLKQNGVDTGMGLERLVMVIQKKKNIFETDLFQPIIDLLKISDKRIQRIVADHIRGSVFLISDDIEPSNVERGYVLRSLLRRIISHLHLLNLERELIKKLVEAVVANYGSVYQLASKDKITDVINKEFDDFSRALEKGLKEFNKFEKIISGKEAFDLHQNYGFRIELMKDLAKERGFSIDEKGFWEEYKKHQEISRAGLERKFGGHGLVFDTGEIKAGTEEELKKVTKLHTATHLLHQALRAVLGNHVKQMGSDITSERLRFDFSHSQKMTPEGIKKIEDLVNQKIKENLKVSLTEMSYEEAMKSGALAFFKEKYPEKVKVYSIGGDPSTGSGRAFSVEICGGPHVEKTADLGYFKIVKEESSAAGIRRIRAVIN